LKNLDQQNATSNTGSGSGSSTTSSSDASSAGGGLAPRGNTTQTINFHFNGPVIGGTKEDLVNALLPQITKALQTKQANSRVNIITGKPN
jgi:hypothetical protein